MEHIIYNSEDEDSEFTFRDEFANLNKELDKWILVIADLGLWNGRKSGWRISKAKNLQVILTFAQGDFYKVFYDSETDDVKADDVHHDGTNHYTFRGIKNNTDIGSLLTKIYLGEHTQADIDKYTVPLGQCVRKIYGWKKDIKKK